MEIEAYVVQDMNAPIILGNDFSDQYSLSILRDEGRTTLRLGNSGQTVSLDSSVNSNYLDVTVLTLRAIAIEL